MARKTKTPLRNLYADRKRYGVNPDGTIRTWEQAREADLAARGISPQEDIQNMKNTLGMLTALNSSLFNK